MEHHLNGTILPILFVLGFTIILSFYLGKSAKTIKLPSIIGFMVFGVVLGPSLFNILTDVTQEKLSFITEIALSFVALSIGLELKISTLKRLGSGIVYIIIFESLGAFVLVLGGLYFLTHNLPLSLIFAAIAPASAPAGTVAIIQEYKAKGNLTKALYAVVGFDDGLGIIIFGFAAAIARMILAQQTSGESENFFVSMLEPLKEVGISIALGTVIAVVFSFLARKLKNPEDTIILVFGFIFVATGLCELWHLSLILTNMVVGMIIINTQPHSLVHKIQNRLPIIMPLLFILFFTLAGSNLHVSALPSLGLIGVVYILTRSGGLIFGSRLGAMLGHVEPNIKKYIGLGILSQAGVAIGLSLIVKQEFKGLGKIIDPLTHATTGDKLGAVVLTTVTATCIFFEIIGPILTKIALTKAGEINPDAVKR